MSNIELKNWFKPSLIHGFRRLEKKPIIKNDTSLVKFLKGVVRLEIEGLARAA
jgi:hypothetical protein